ncbi:energy transducer TonB [Flavobacterium amniphilum]|uniref:energy transducer TonB n=1 Tax=Flavobacterium amniphilum TaxID=1834035 RepID=UPI00202A6C81|nr:energy transducer TonB [Flavobacterium amniphilum]MCL9806697.1 energy transducer TonB [Flavobacterium amniphilum]
MKRILLIAVFFVAQYGFAQAPINVANKNLPIPYEEVENRPMYPGGINEFIKFVGKNFQMPDVEGVSGVIKVSFVIETNGVVTDVKVLNDLGHGTGAEAKRVVLLSPKWTPGDQDGKAVRVTYTLPITIRNY